MLATVEGHPAKAGKVAAVTSLSLGGVIQQNAWYRVLLTAMVDGAPRITGQVFRHAVATDPDSPISQVGGTLVYEPASLPAGVDTLGQNAIIGSAFSAVVNASVTNFSNVLADCCPVLADCLGGGGTSD